MAVGHIECPQPSPLNQRKVVPVHQAPSAFHTAFEEYLWNFEIALVQGKSLFDNLIIPVYKN